MSSLTNEEMYKGIENYVTDLKEILNMIYKHNPKEYKLIDEIMFEIDELKKRFWLEVEDHLEEMKKSIEEFKKEGFTNG